MGRVEQKVSLNPRNFIRGHNQMGRAAKRNLDNINKDLNKSGDAAKDFANKNKKSVAESKSAFASLAQGFKGSLGKLSAAGVGLAIGGAVTKEIIESLSFEDIINRISAKLGLNEVRQAELRGQLIDISSARNVEEEEAAVAADVAINLGAAADEAVRFADVIATAVKSFEGLEAGSLAKTIASDIRDRGREVTSDEARKSIEAIISGTRAGIGDFNEVLKGLTNLQGPVQQRAGLSQRDLVELLGGAGGVAADPDLIRDAIQALIRATDKIEERGAVQGVLGASLRDAEGKFEITARNLETIQENISRLGTEQQQRAVLTGLPGFDERAAEGLLALIRDRTGFEQARERTRRDRPELEQIFEKSTSGILEGAGAFFNKLGNQLFKGTGGARPQRAITTRSGNVIGKTQDELNEEFERRRQEKSPLAPPTPRGQSLRSVIRSTIKESRETTSTNSVAAAGSNGADGQNGVQSSELKVKVEIDSKDPGFVGRPKASEVSRNTGGF